MSALMTGWILGTVKNDIETQLSHIQIHDTAFLANYDINAYFYKDDISSQLSVFSSTEAENYKLKTTYRLNLTGMLASPYNVIGVTAKGVPEDEEM
jgi:hypothetical protein